MVVAVGRVRASQFWAFAEFVIQDAFGFKGITGEIYTLISAVFQEPGGPEPSKELGIIL
jgi:hypothetical protein